MSPRCAAAHYYLGMTLKADHELDRALGMFCKAIELDSRMIDAEREIRLIHMRREKEKATEKRGLFDRFRKPHK
jgi:hypothetical protein